MPVPTHRYDCTTRIWRMKCDGCKQWVSFFSCSCGSKVVFNRPHPPWIRHRDTCQPALIQEVSNETGRTPRQVERWIEAEGRKRGVIVPAEVRRLLAANTNKATGRSTKMLILPGEDVEEGELITTRGEVHEANPANIFKQAGYADNAMGRKILDATEKGLGTEPLVELKIRGHRDPETGFMDEYPVITLWRVWDGSGVHRHEIARVTFKKVDFVKGQRIWFAVSIEAAPD